MKYEHDRSEPSLQLHINNKKSAIKQSNYSSVDNGFGYFQKEGKLTNVNTERVQLQLDENFKRFTHWILERTSIDFVQEELQKDDCMLINLSLIQDKLHLHNQN